VEGKSYSVVEIGTDCWMAENLATTKYRNGDVIESGIAPEGWTAATVGAVVSVNGDSANDGTYGKLYNGLAIFDARGLCPEGWHPGTLAEWDTLIASQGGEALAGGALRTVMGWLEPNGLWLAQTTMQEPLLPVSSELELSRLELRSFSLRWEVPNQESELRPLSADLASSLVRSQARRLGPQEAAVCERWRGLSTPTLPESTRWEYS